jgi:PhnB protein
MTTKSIPSGYEAWIPHLVVRNADKAIDFYKELFGATEKERMRRPGSSQILHAELQIRNQTLMLAGENRQWNSLSPQSVSGPPPVSVMLYVTDVDAVHKKALSLGAKELMAPTDMFWGDRYAKFVDPFGHHGGIATHQRDLSQQELQAGAEEWFNKMAA